MSGCKSIPVPQAKKANLGPSAAPANRVALVAAAREVFGARGADAPLSAIARAAGVGQGSLYRHFPTRQSLALAVFEENMVQIEDVAAAPGSTLWDVADHLTHLIEGSAGIIDYLLRQHADEPLAAFQERLLAVIRTKWDSAVEANQVRRGVTIDDFMFAIAMVSGVVTRVPAHERHDAAARAWELLSARIGGPH